MRESNHFRDPYTCARRCFLGQALYEIKSSLQVVKVNRSLALNVLHTVHSTEHVTVFQFMVFKTEILMFPVSAAIKTSSNEIRTVQMYSILYLRLSNKLGAMMVIL